MGDVHWHIIMADNNVGIVTINFAALKSLEKRTKSRAPEFEEKKNLGA